ncbi:transcription elongation factor Spt5 [archaeon]|nr:transcription elongation factor Spt5 [archaeon]
MAFESDEFDYLEEAKKPTVAEEALPAISSVKEEKSIIPVQEEPVEEVVEASESSPSKEKEEPVEKESVIFAVKVTTKKETNALELISEKVKKKGIEVYSVACPHGLRGYLFLEAKDRENAEEAVFNLPYVKGIIPKTLDYSELKSMLEPVAADIKIEKGDIIEIIAEPFKKEKAKVIRVDKAKEEAIVSLLNAIVPIPVTVKLDNIRVIRREDEEE